MEANDYINELPALFRRHILRFTDLSLSPLLSLSLSKQSSDPEVNSLFLRIRASLLLCLYSLLDFAYTKNVCRWRWTYACVCVSEVPWCNYPERLWIDFVIFFRAEFLLLVSDLAFCFLSDFSGLTDSISRFICDLCFGWLIAWVLLDLFEFHEVCEMIRASDGFWFTLNFFK